MLLSTMFPALSLYLVCIIASLITPATAPPFSRFIRHIQSQDAWRSLNLPSGETRLQRRGLPGAVYTCTDQNFRGDCAWIMPSTSCHIPGTVDDTPRSIGPDSGGFCVLYEKATCSGNQVITLRFPGLGSAIPEFGGLKCFVDEQGQSSNGTGFVQNGGVTGSGILPAGKDGADPRLAGGAGSAERKRLKDIMAEMEKDGFEDGMMGLEKEHYY